MSPGMVSSYEAGRSATRANDQWWQLPFRCFFNEPHFMGALDTTNEGDNAHLRYQWLGSRHVNVRVEEDTTHDSLLAHHEGLPCVGVAGGASTLFGAAGIALTNGSTRLYELLCQFPLNTGCGNC